MHLRSVLITLTTLSLAATTYAAIPSAANTQQAGASLQSPQSPDVRIVTSRERWGLSTDRTTVTNATADPYNQSLIGIVYPHY